MKYFWDSSEEIKKEIQQHSRLLILFDFDGTLAPIALQPGAAAMPEKTKQLLEKIAATDTIRVIIVSGRHLENIKEKAGISRIAYAGNHGMEWEIDGKKESIELSEGYLKTLGEIKSKCKELEKQYLQTMVQDKRMTISIHYRALDEKFVQAFISKLHIILDPYVNAKQISLLQGKKVAEIRPYKPWTKGDFIHKFLAERCKDQHPYVIYVGDDTTDEDAFQAIPEGLSIYVGKKTNSHAKFYLKNVDEVQRFMRYILKV